MIVFSMRYSDEQLFYQVIVHPFEEHSQFVEYAHSVIHHVYIFVPGDMHGRLLLADAQKFVWG